MNTENYYNNQNNEELIQNIKFFREKKLKELIKKNKMNKYRINKIN